MSYRKKTLQNSFGKNSTEKCQKRQKVTLAQNFTIKKFLRIKFQQKINPKLQKKKSKIMKTIIGKSQFHFFCLEKYSTLVVLSR